MARSRNDVSAAGTPYDTGCIRLRNRRLGTRSVSRAVRGGGEMTILLVCQPCGKTAAIEGVDVLRHSVEFMRAAEVAGWTVVTDYRRSCVAAFCCEAHA